MATRVGPSNPVPFEPTADQLGHMPQFRRGQVPRYLFRVHTPYGDGTRTSAGMTSTLEVRSGEALKNFFSTGVDIFAQEPEVASRLLGHHLNWVRSKGVYSNLTSWMCSLLVALQYGLSRFAPGRGWPDLSECYLMILDTQKLPPGTFVKDTEILEALAATSRWASEGYNPVGVDRLLRLRTLPTKSGEMFFFGEYLSQGTLDVEGRCAQTTMENLVSLGLFDVHPEFKDPEEWHRFPRRILELRHLLDSYYGGAHPATKEIVRKAIVVACTGFGDRWGPPVAIMLLSLRSRGRNDEAIQHGIAAMFEDHDILASLLGFVDTIPPPEVEQFALLAQEACDRTQSQNIYPNLLRY